MIEAVVRFCVRHALAVLAAVVVFVIVAFNAFRELPVQAFPDVTDPSVDVIATFPGQAAEDVERRVTLELERVLAGTPHMTNLRSVSVFGLALVTLRFDDVASERDNRAQVAERLGGAALPAAAAASMGPQSTPVGQIYRYTLSGALPLKDLRSLQDWVIERQLRGVPGVAEVVTFGGFERQYQIRIDPVRIANLGVSVADVYRAVEKTSSNAGGGYVGIGSQEFVVRGLGSMRDPKDIGAALVAEYKGVAIHVRDVAEVIEGAVPRRGAVARGEEGEVVEGIVLLRRGENPSAVLSALHERVAELNDTILPRGVKIVPFYDRGALIAATLDTVGKNLLEGGVLVVAVLYVFLKTLRGALVVALVIPLALLTSFVGLRLMGLPANLISLGAIDFGILVDGSVVVLEATLLALSTAHATTVAERRDVVVRASGAVARSVAFAMLVIIAGLIPIFTLQRVEGRIFAPMAFTYVFALVGALVAAITVVPVLESMVLVGAVHDEAPPRWFSALLRLYLAALTRAERVRGAVLVGLVVGGVGVAVGGAGIGTEFLPELNEGGLYITCVFPSSIALDETRAHVPEIQRRILALPEVRDVLSHVGRPDDATQTEGPNNVELFVVLAPMAEWRPHLGPHDLEDELRHSLEEIPGVEYNFSQPITDRVYETISGIIGQVVVKLRGDDLAKMTEAAEQIKVALSTVPGVADLSIYQAGETRQLTIELDRERLARFGLTVEEAQQTIEIALGGKVATMMWDGERRYGVALRLPDSVRSDPDALGRLVIGDPERRVTLREVADVRLTQGRSAIWRENLARFVAIKLNVRGRDLGSVVAEGRAKVARTVPLPDGVRATWGGEFENQERAMKRLVVVIPVALLAIVVLLYANFRRARPALLIAATLPFALAGAIAALRVTGQNFSVSAAVGCIALLGQVALAGVLVCARIDANVLLGAPDAAHRGAGEALRPVLLTTTLAALGLVPAALSHGMGSETQRPFAIAIIGGLVVVLPVVLFLLPLASVTRKKAGAGGPIAASAALLLALVVTFAPRVALADEVPRRDARLRDVELLARWMASGREVASWRAQVGAARFDVVTATLLPNPSIAATVGANLAGPAVNGETVLSAQLSMPLPISGQIAARREAALKQLAAVEVNAAVLLWSRAREIRASMVERAFAAARVEMIARNREQLGEIERIVRSRAAAGVSSEYDVRRVAVAIATMRADGANAEAARDRAEADLLGRIGDPALAEAPVQPGDLTPLDELALQPGLVERALRARPDLELARRSAVASDAFAESSRKAAVPMPTFLVGPSVATTSHDGTSVFLSAGLALPLPLFDRNQGLTGRARLEAQAQRELAAVIEVRIRIEVDRLTRIRTRAESELAAFRRSGVLATDELRDRALRAYEAGTFTVAELLDAYRARWEARSEELELARTLADTDVALSSALGTTVPGAPIAPLR